MIKGSMKDSFENQYNDTIKNYTILGNCSRCGNCCTDLLCLDSEEIDRIDKYLEKNKIEQHNKGKCNLCCPFRNDEKKICEIYEVRPDICRVFKCDKTLEQARAERNQLNYGKEVRSMAQLFFKDSSKANLLKKAGVKVKKR